MKPIGVIFIGICMLFFCPFAWQSGESALAIMLVVFGFGLIAFGLHCRLPNCPNCNAHKLDVIFVEANQKIGYGRIIEGKRAIGVRCLNCGFTKMVNPTKFREK